MKINNEDGFGAFDIFASLLMIFLLFGIALIIAA